MHGWLYIYIQLIALFRLAIKSRGGSSLAVLCWCCETGGGSGLIQMCSRVDLIEDDDFIMIISNVVPDLSK